MPEIDVVDATWIDVPPAAVAPLVADAARWPGWWPDLVLEAAERRGAKGMRWRVLAADRGRVHGSMEIWLQPTDGGTVAHYFLRLDGARHPLRRRERLRVMERHRFRGRAVMWAISDELDPGRLARVAAPPWSLRTVAEIP